MPIYSNVPLIMCCSRSYDSGRLRRKCNYFDRRHIDAPLEVSRNIVRDIGMFDIEGGKVINDFMITTSYYGYTLSSTRKNLIDNTKYSSIDLILYTVSPKADLSKGRKDAILVREENAGNVKVISGGSICKKTSRCYDNIILKAHCVWKPVIITIQRDRDCDRLQRGDYVYIVSREGVKQIHLGKDDITPLIENKVSFETKKWQYI